MGGHWSTWGKLICIIGSGGSNYSVLLLLLREGKRGGGKGRGAIMVICTQWKKIILFQFFFFPFLPFRAFASPPWLTLTNKSAPRCPTAIRNSSRSTTVKPHPPRRERGRVRKTKRGRKRGRRENGWMEEKERKKKEGKSETERAKARDGI